MPIEVYGYRTSGNHFRRIKIVQKPNKLPRSLTRRRARNGDSPQPRDTYSDLDESQPSFFFQTEQRKAIRRFLRKSEGYVRSLACKQKLILIPIILLILLFLFGVGLLYAVLENDNVLFLLFGLVPLGALLVCAVVNLRSKRFQRTLSLLKFMAKRTRGPLKAKIGKSGANGVDWAQHLENNLYIRNNTLRSREMQSRVEMHQDRDGMASISSKTSWSHNGGNHKYDNISGHSRGSAGSQGSTATVNRLRDALLDQRVEYRLIVIDNEKEEDKEVLMSSSTFRSSVSRDDTHQTGGNVGNSVYRAEKKGMITTPKKKINAAKLTNKPKNEHKNGQNASEKVKQIKENLKTSSTSSVSSAIQISRIQGDSLSMGTPKRRLSTPIRSVNSTTPYYFEDFNRLKIFDFLIEFRQTGSPRKPALNTEFLTIQETEEIKIVGREPIPEEDRVEDEGLDDNPTKRMKSTGHKPFRMAQSEHRGEVRNVQKAPVAVGQSHKQRQISRLENKRGQINKPNTPKSRNSRDNSGYSGPVKKESHAAESVSSRSKTTDKYTNSSIARLYEITKEKKKAIYFRELEKQNEALKRTKDEGEETARRDEIRKLRKKINEEFTKTHEVELNNKRALVEVLRKEEWSREMFYMFGARNYLKKKYTVFHEESKNGGSQKNFESQMKGILPPIEEKL